ncbi:phage terminase large subunit [Acetobacteraceae bacterium KSS8]|uniref:Phage terminase large subunit n=1 Tax=Endosaccharibacter trunci TaxID=2812733 RepID=A0ABT1WAH4_9PROT|nr:phage terminase large subunit [Acetobacteraceae bacterium KSS8]
MTPTFRLTELQDQATDLLASPARHILLRGGSRSGKTFALTRAVAVRAIKAPETRHGVFRHAFNAVKQSIILDTFPKMMKLCFPEVTYKLDKTDWFVRLPNGSELWFGGLDDKERTEKILGKEFATVYLNEASQISYGARNMLLTRLAQQSPLALKEYVDANPPTQSHWLYTLWERGIEPKSGEPLRDPTLYATMQLNPDSNRQNLAPEYLESLDALPEKERRRFLLGEYLTAVDGALWSMDRIRRVEPVTDANIDAIRGQMRRILISADPSGCSGDEDTRSDEIGIVAAGVDIAGVVHLLEDATGRYSPDGWARMVIALYDKWQADRIVAERNYGGALVESTIRSARATAPVHLVTASRGKHVRAEPVAALYEQGKAVHHGRFPDLEDQLCQFSAAGYQGAKSPDRADAWVWAVTDLVLGEPPAAPARWAPSPISFGR